MGDKLVKNQKETEEISLTELVSKLSTGYHYLLSKWLIIFIFGIVGGILGVVYAGFKKPVYTAATTFVLEDGDGGGGGLGQYSGLASMVGIDVGGGGGIFQGDNILELYKSRKMIEKTLLTEVEYNGKKELLVDLYIEFNNLRENWKDIPELKTVKFKKTTVEGSKPGFTRLQDSLLGAFVKDINKGYLSVAKLDKKLSIIKAEVKAQDEFFAKSFNDEIVRNVNDFYIQTKTKKSIANVIILQQKADSVRAALNGAIFSGAAVFDATPNLNLTRQVQRSAPMQRSQVSAETNKAVLAELVKNLELSKMSLRKETPLIQVVDEPVLPLDMTKFSKLKGIVIGGFLFGFFTCLILIVRKNLKPDLVQ
ncbi:Wzz/FepE/Etk N-terminal domain-containing protein [Pedobacter hartonius]|uniref:Chain length determinant protein n=1 Tax=Pedobacter hartonius TaxID=425514 RepID=A0A1H4FSG8_9SPHI|nr:Wzz/FepE/Etk N-terminal domain-containing protein [Pedobacter hartonius]SEB00017.1 Chain length determinant protein [Pedobacter hartonius]